ncbi:hypothetical protein PV11_07488 [Exophiala sideris]|uniref:Epoxide hydrolase N-terminal domain-containing protein n=1 Tax=Exophiala sideris TaxID=1016849 RepID=A0A0D1YGA0_9EURO|nr:hypothetical protein PV11_07488 [Exophiala sideris]
MSPIRPYTISVPESKIERLKQKLALFDLPDEVPGVEPWSRGPPLADIKRLAAYWANGFDWRKVEAKLNSIPNFMTSIDVDGFSTYDVHFVHQTSKVKNAVPLLFAHGWPGNFTEVTKVLPFLVDGGKDSPSFHVVAPSLVDFGFSQAAMKPGFNIDQHAEVCHKLMLQLGYDEYVVQGGDIGYPITRLMAKNYPQHCKAHHVNMAMPAEPTLTAHPALYAQVQATPLTDFEKAGLDRTKWFRADGSGYMIEQGTKPQTIGVAVTSSPVALLTWVYEKLHDWSDGYAWTDDEVLTWVSIYEFSAGGPAATQRIYYDDRKREGGSAFVAAQEYIDSPLGVMRLPKELVQSPELWHHTMGPVVLIRQHERGGHFAAWEVPDLLAGDLREMFGRGGGAFGCVSGKNGYDDE